LLGVFNISHLVNYFPPGRIIHLSRFRKRGKKITPAEGKKDRRD
jgi:hypothetical protein